MRLLKLALLLCLIPQVCLARNRFQGLGNVLPFLTVNYLEDMLFCNSESPGYIHLTEDSRIIKPANLYNFIVRELSVGVLLAKSSKVDFAFDSSTLGFPILSIFLVCAQEKVLKPYTSSIVTMMANAIPMRIYTRREEICKPVRRDLFSTNPQLAISSPICLSVPDPTTIFRFCNTSPKVSNCLFMNRGQR